MVLILQNYYYKISFVTFMNILALSFFSYFHYKIFSLGSIQWNRCSTVKKHVNLRGMHSPTVTTNITSSQKHSCFVILKQICYNISSQKTALLSQKRLLTIHVSLLLSVESQCFESVSNFLMMIVHVAEFIVDMLKYKKVSFEIGG